MSSAPAQSDWLALQIEQRVDRPGKLRVERHRALGEMPRSVDFAFALRLEEEAAQAELLGIGGGEHRFEDAPRRRAVAGKLRGLRAQEMRQRLVRQRLARLDRGAHGGRAVAGAERDHAARQGVEPELLAALRQYGPDHGGALPDVADERPDDERGDDERKQQDDGAKDARLDHVALPVDGKLARTVGEPGEPAGDERHRDEEADQAQHLAVPYSCDLRWRGRRRHRAKP